MNLLFDFLAPIYDFLAAFRKQERLPEILKLPIAGNLIDVGGGTGRVSQDLQAQVSYAVLLDLSMPMLRKARRRDNLFVFQAKAEHIPCLDAAFERVLVVDAFHHFQKQENVASELYRILKPGGRLVIEEQDRQYFFVKFVSVIEKILLTKSSFYKPSEIVAMFESLGAQSHIEKAKYFSKFIIIDKPNQVF